MEVIYKNSLVEKILPFLRRRSKMSYIGVAVLCLFVERVYSILRVPKNLRHFPSVGYLTMLKSILYNESLDDRTNRLIRPLVENGAKAYVTKFPLLWTVFLTDPVAARTMLLKTESFPKSNSLLKSLSETSPIVQFMGHDNVAISNGERWKGQRKIMNPAFHRSMPVQRFGKIVPKFFKLVNEDGEDTPIADNMRALTLDILGQTAFGFDFKSTEGDPEGWTSTYKLVIATLFNPWVGIFAHLDFLTQYISPSRRRSMAATAKFNGMIEDLITRKRDEIRSNKAEDIPDNEKDLLRLMIEADDRGEGFTSVEELRHNISLFFLAGHDTTSHTLSFCLYNLAKNKDVQERLRKDIIKVLGDDPEDVYPTLEELRAIPYMDCVIKENLRKNGPANMLLIRNAEEDMDLNGVIIEKDTKVSVDITMIHLHPKYWTNPENFDPDRFAENGEHGTHSGLTWVPFSNGTRQCIGMNFSLTEQRVVLAMMLRKYNIDIDKNSEHYDKIQFEVPFNQAPPSLALRFTKRY